MPARKGCGNIRNGTTVPDTAKRISCVGANCVRPQGLRKFAAGRRVVAPYKIKIPFERNCKVYLQSKFTICSASHAAEKETVFLRNRFIFSQGKARRRRCMQIQRAARNTAFCEHQFPIERNCKVSLQSKFTICSASHAAEKETISPRVLHGRV